MNKTKLDVLLIIPPFLELDNFQQEKYEFLGVGYLVSNLPENITGGFIDAYNYNYSYSEILNMVNDYEPKVIGISIAFYNSIPSSIKLIEHLRENGYEGHITVGGHAAVSCKETLITKAKINSLCLCEGEQVFPLLIDKIIKKESYKNILGYWFKIHGEVVKNKSIPLIEDLDSIKFPERKNIITNKTLVQDFGNNAVYSVCTSRGCPFNCSFCDIKAFYNSTPGKNWRMRSVKNIIEEIQYMYDELGARVFFFGDDNFIGSTTEGFERAYEFCDEIEKRSLEISFAIEGRVTDVNTRLFRRLKEVGLQTIMLGIENGSQKTLNRWNKGLKIEQSIEAIRLLNKLHIKIHANYILLDIESDLEDLEQNLYFLKKTKLYNDYNPIYLFDNILGIFPNTEVEKQLRKDNKLCKFTSSGFSKESLDYINSFESIYSYKFVNSEVENFVILNNYWIDKVEQEIKSRKFSLKEINRIYKKIGRLYISLFEKSVLYASKTVSVIHKNEYIGISELDDLIIEFFDSFSYD